MDWITASGMLAAVCTTLSFVPQALKTIRSKDTSGISLTMYSVFTFGTLMWLIFGMASNNTPVTLANAITLLLACTILYYKLRYK